MNRKEYNTPATLVMKIQAICMNTNTRGTNIKGNTDIYYDGSTNENGRSRSSSGFWDIGDE